MNPSFSVSDEAGFPWPQHIARFQEYVERFAACFRRRDQARWMIAYLSGLLWSDQRKNAEALARTLLPRDEKETPNFAQALQNFVNQSPWDEQAVWERYRHWVQRRLAGRPVTCVVEEIGFAKQGNRSVGVQRQLWHENGKKVNCQLALIAYAVADGEAHPIAARLYLPRTWTNDPERMARAGVPEAHRQPTAKNQIARDLLEELTAEGWAFHSILAGGRWAGADEFRRQMCARPWISLLEANADQVHYPWIEPPPGVETLVTESARFFTVPWPNNDAAGDRLTRRLLVADPAGAARQFVFARVPVHQPLGETVQLWQRRQQTSAAHLRMRQHLGLDHFEGRSWRGFHHHVCLVALAHGFLLDVGRDQLA